MGRVRDGDYTLVTNNAVDFRRLYRREDLHAGLVLLLTQLPEAEQLAVFRDVLVLIGGRDLVNTVLGSNSLAESCA